MGNLPAERLIAARLAQSQTSLAGVSHVGEGIKRQGEGIMTPFNSTSESTRRQAGDHWLSAILDEIDYGIVSYGVNGILRCNRAADALLASSDCPLLAHDGRLRARDHRQDKSVQDAMRDALERGRRRLVTLIGADRPFPVAFVPLTNCGVADDGPAAMLVTGKRDLCPTLTAYWFCVAHHLSPAESGVLTELLAGFQPRAIAQRKGVAVSTVRTQINTISEKTRARGIRELVMMAAGLPPMISMTVQ
jgi:DNA-binding CsgD family transcriptional regulator